MADNPLEISKSIKAKITESKKGLSSKADSKPEKTNVKTSGNIRGSDKVHYEITRFVPAKTKKINVKAATQVKTDLTQKPKIAKPLKKELAPSVAKIKKAKAVPAKKSFTPDKEIKKTIETKISTENAFLKKVLTDHQLLKLTSAQVQQLQKIANLQDETQNSTIRIAQYHLAKLYLNGYHIPKDLNQAFHYFTLAAKKLLIEAYVPLGQCYENDWGVRAVYKSDPPITIHYLMEQALYWYEKSEKFNNIEGLYRLPRLILTITTLRMPLEARYRLLVMCYKACPILFDLYPRILRGNPKLNQPEAIIIGGNLVIKQYLQKISLPARKGHSLAQLELGEYFHALDAEVAKRYHRPIEMKPNTIFWLEKAAYSGHVEAQFLLAEGYRTGKFDEEDEEKINRLRFKFYEMAAQQQYKDSQFWTAYYLHNNIGVPEDLKPYRQELAIFYYQKEVAQNHPQANLFLAQCLEENITEYTGGISNFDLAVRHYNNFLKQFPREKRPIFRPKNPHWESASYGLERLSTPAYNKAMYLKANIERLAEELSHIEQGDTREKTEQSIVDEKMIAEHRAKIQQQILNLLSNILDHHPFAAESLIACLLDTKNFIASMNVLERDAILLKSLVSLIKVGNQNHGGFARVVANSLNNLVEGNYKLAKYYLKKGEISSAAPYMIVGAKKDDPRAKYYLIEQTLMHMIGKHHAWNEKSLIEDLMIYYPSIGILQAGDYCFAQWKLTGNHRFCISGYYWYQKAIEMGLEVPYEKMEVLKDCLSVDDRNSFTSLKNIINRDIPSEDLERTLRIQTIDKTRWTPTYQDRKIFYPEIYFPLALQPILEDKNGIINACKDVFKGVAARLSVFSIDIYGGQQTGLLNEINSSQYTELVIWNFENDIRLRKIFSDVLRLFSEDIVGLCFSYLTGLDSKAFLSPASFNKKQNQWVDRANIFFDQPKKSPLDQISCIEAYYWLQRAFAFNGAVPFDKMDKLENGLTNRDRNLLKHLIGLVNTEEPSENLRLELTCQFSQASNYRSYYDKELIIEQWKKRNIDLPKKLRFPLEFEPRIDIRNKIRKAAMKVLETGSTQFLTTPSILNVPSVEKRLEAYQYAELALWRFEHAIRLRKLLSDILTMFSEDLIGLFFEYLTDLKSTGHLSPASINQIQGSVQAGIQENGLLAVEHIPYSQERMIYGQRPTIQQLVDNLEQEFVELNKKELKQKEAKAAEEYRLYLERDEANRRTAKEQQAIAPIIFSVSTLKKNSISVPAVSTQSKASERVKIGSAS